MEDVLDVYTKPYDPHHPVVCMDERPMQLLKATRMSLPLAPGKPARFDYEYERRGTAVHFLFTEPLSSWRRVSVREKRTAIDWATEMRVLQEVNYPKAKKGDGHNGQSQHAQNRIFYEAFPAAKARRLASRLDIRYTPKHGSWLNIAECELSALVRQCLNRRLSGIRALRKETAAWQRKRNAARKKVDWRFTTKNARIKLKRLYPQF